jgi:hypothetical protein
MDEANAGENVSVAALGQSHKYLDIEKKHKVLPAYSLA